ncbi:MAG: hypothetical protein WCJ76_08735 [Comamonadaceae bacterium]
MRKFDRADFLNALLYVPTAFLPLGGAACLALDLHMLCWLLMGLALLWLPGCFFLIWLYQPALMAWVNAPTAASDRPIATGETTN